MTIITSFVDFIRNIDQHLIEMIQNFGNWTYLILFIVIFCETGLVFLPFLPGDSLIFASCALAGKGTLNIGLLYLLFLSAAILGDTVNYEIGKKLGNRVLSKPNRLIKKEHIEKTQNFFERHGGKSIILARFIPIIRTFAPFVAGISEMHYFKFLSFNALGGFLWVTLFTVLGYFFGNIPFVKEHFSIFIICIIVVSILPACYAIIESLITKHKQTKTI